MNKTSMIALLATVPLILTAPHGAHSAATTQTIPNPTNNIPASTEQPGSCYGYDSNTDAFTGRSSYADNCQGADIASLNNARAQMDDPAHRGSKLPAYALPANFTSMPVADQILLLVN